VPRKKVNIPNHRFPDQTTSGVIIAPIESTRWEDLDIHKPHRDNHFHLLVVTSGQWTMQVDFETMHIKGPGFLRLLPGQVHQLVDAKSAQGWAIAADPSTLPLELATLLETRVPLTIPLKQNAFFKQITDLLALMCNVYSSGTDIYKGKSVHFLFSAFLTLLAGEITFLSPDDVRQEKRGYIIWQSFQVSLKANFKTTKSPAAYAAKLSITTSHLNDTIKDITGKSVSEHIQEQIIYEAKRLLYFTDKEVREIAFDLGYPDSAHFGKLFRKATGLTPLHFRRQFRD
jgi:AraC-like DNA-binding protein